MPIWPVAPFPQNVLHTSYVEETPLGHIRTEMDAGPAKTRKRTDRNPIKFRGALVLTSTQTQDLDDFYQDTLSWGALSFEWLHQRTGSTGDFRFVGAPKYTPYGLHYKAQIEWEQLST